MSRRGEPREQAHGCQEVGAGGRGGRRVTAKEAWGISGDDKTDLKLKSGDDTMTI